jgi:FXSXX-COOH protein
MIGESATANYDIADGGLIDVREFSLGDLLDEPDQSSLARALERILASSEDSAPQNGFQSSI